MDGENKELTKLLSLFEALPETKVSESIFDIAGYPHYENVSSNILAFYFDPNGEHGLSDLFLSTLMEFADETFLDEGNILISREVSTIKGGRLDILIETDNQIIGIENKIFHILNNNLEDYSDSIEKWAKLSDQNKDRKKFVLSIRNEPNSFGFINVTYKEYWQSIRSKLGNYISTSSQKWALYLIDFMSSIDNLYGNNMDIDKNDLFFIENEDRVNNLINKRNRFIQKLNSKVNNLAKIIEKPSDCKKQWIYAKSCLVHDYNISGNQIAFDMKLAPKGWRFTVFGRNNSSSTYLSKLLKQSIFSAHSIPLVNGRYVINQYDLTADLNVIKADMLNWFSNLSMAANDCK